jgi:hypothetical protein
MHHPKLSVLIRTVLPATDLAISLPRWVIRVSGWKSMRRVLSIAAIATGDLF